MAPQVYIYHHFYFFFYPRSYHSRKFQTKSLHIFLMKWLLRQALLIIGFTIEYFREVVATRALICDQMSIQRAPNSSFPNKISRDRNYLALHELTFDRVCVRVSQLSISLRYGFYIWHLGRWWYEHDVHVCMSKPMLGRLVLSTIYMQNKENKRCIHTAFIFSLKFQWYFVVYDIDEKSNNSISQEFKKSKKRKALGPFLGTT